jgi:DDE superfamily endonuclease
MELRLSRRSDSEFSSNIRKPFTLGWPPAWIWKANRRLDRNIVSCFEIISFHTRHKLETCPDILVASRAAYYSQCLSERGSVLPNVVGFIDGTAIDIARPSGFSHRATYSGHKRRTYIEFQAISAPDGLILHHFSPMEGRRHNMTLYQASQIDGVLQHSLLINEIQYYL